MCFKVSADKPSGVRYIAAARLAMALQVQGPLVAALWDLSPSQLTPSAVWLMKEPLKYLGASELLGQK